MSSTRQLLDIFIENQSGELSRELAVTASNNRVLYHISKKTEGDLARKINKEGQVWISKLKKTLDLIESVLDNETPHLITRTYKFFEFVTYDVDLYVPASYFDKAKELFIKANCKLSSHDSSLGGRIQSNQVNIHKDGILVIDMHKDFTWQKKRFIDVSSILEKKKLRMIGKTKVDTPAPEVEFLLTVADISHERFFITLADLFFLYKLSKEITNWEYILDQARFYGWEKTYINTCRYINGLTKAVFGQHIIQGVNSIEVKNICLPFFLPLKLCYLSYWENFIQSKSFPIISFLYLHYARLKHFLTGAIPYYSHWSKYLLNSNK